MQIKAETILHNLYVSLCFFCSLLGITTDGKGRITIFLCWPIPEGITILVQLMKRAELLFFFVGLFLKALQY